MQTSTILGSATVGLSALLALGTLLVIRTAQPRRIAGAAPVAAVARCLDEVQQAGACECVRGTLRHSCYRTRWRAMRGCRDGALDFGSTPSVISPTVWCTPQLHETTTAKETT